MPCTQKHSKMTITVRKSNPDQAHTTYPHSLFLVRIPPEGDIYHHVLSIWVSFLLWQPQKSFSEMPWLVFFTKWQWLSSFMALQVSMTIIQVFSELCCLSSFFCSLPYLIQSNPVSCLFSQISSSPSKTLLEALSVCRKHNRFLR